MSLEKRGAGMHGVCYCCEDADALRLKAAEQEKEIARLTEMVRRAGRIFDTMPKTPKLGEWNWPQLADEFKKAGGQEKEIASPTRLVDVIFDELTKLCPPSCPGCPMCTDPSFK